MPNVHFFGVLREKAAACLQIFCLTQAAGLDGDGCSDGVAVTLVSAQTKGDGAAEVAHVVA